LEGSIKLRFYLHARPCYCHCEHRPCLSSLRAPPSYKISKM